MYLEVVRKPHRGRLRRAVVRTGPADDYDFSTPSVASDGWVALAFKRHSTIASSDSVGYVVAMRPSGRTIVTRLSGYTSLDGVAATVTTGGRGAAGFAGVLPNSTMTLGRASWLALAGGRPQAGESLERSTTGALIQHTVMTSNRRDRARVVFTEGDRVFASRLP